MADDPRRTRATRASPGGISGLLERMFGPSVIRRVQADGGALSCASETQNGRHHLLQRHRCPDFVVSYPAK